MVEALEEPKTRAFVCQTCENPVAAASELLPERVAVLNEAVYAYELSVLDSDSCACYSATNPSDQRYDVARFRPPSGRPRLVYAGDTSTEHSWFPPHTWQCVFCPLCRTHLGWAFSDAAQHEPLGGGESRGGDLGAAPLGAAERAAELDSEAATEVTTETATETATETTTDERRREIRDEIIDESVDDLPADRVVFLGLVLTQLAERTLPLSALEPRSAATSGCDTHFSHTHTFHLLVLTAHSRFSLISPTPGWRLLESIEALVGNGAESVEALVGNGAASVGSRPDGLSDGASVATPTAASAAASAAASVAASDAAGTGRAEVTDADGSRFERFFAEGRLRPSANEGGASRRRALPDGLQSAVSVLLDHVSTVVSPAEGGAVRNVAAGGGNGENARSDDIVMHADARADSVDFEVVAQRALASNAPAAALPAPPETEAMLALAEAMIEAQGPRPAFSDFGTVPTSNPW